MGFDWSKLAGPAIGGGLALLGGKMQSNAANKQSDKEWELMAQEMARRNMLQGMAAPSLLRAIGYRNPQQINSMTQAIGGQAPQQAQSTGAPTVPQGHGGAMSGIAKGAATGAALGSFLPGVGNMVGGGVGAIAGGLGSIGAGRRTADDFVSAVENPYGQQLSQFDSQGGSLDDFEKAYQNYMNQVNAWRAQGGNQAKVAGQSLQNQGLQNTISGVRRKLGGY